MIRLNRTTEYGLIALRHMNTKQMSQAGVTSAREISDRYGLPFEITAKTLQRLKDTGLILSAQGARGGYTLNCELSQVTLARFLELMEGPQSVVACLGGDGPQTGELPILKSSRKKSGDCCCEYETRCELKSVMGELNQRIYNFLGSIRLSEVAVGEDRPDEEVKQQQREAAVSAATLN